MMRKRGGREEVASRRKWIAADCVLGWQTRHLWLQKREKTQWEGLIMIMIMTMSPCNRDERRIANSNRENPFL